MVRLGVPLAGGRRRNFGGGCGGSSGRGGQANDSVNVRVYLRGDVDHGDSVDIFDVIDTINAFGTSSGDPDYNANADFDGNGTVDIFDVIDVVGSFGRSIQ